jgi:hypothetical protein
MKKFLASFTVLLFPYAGSAQSNVSVYELTTSSDTYFAVNVDNGIATVTRTQRQQNGGSGPQLSGNNSSTVLASQVFGSFDVALAATPSVTVCQADGVWVEKSSGFLIGPFDTSIGFQPAQRYITGTLSLSADGTVNVRNNIVSRFETAAPNAARSQQVLRTLAFSLPATVTETTSVAATYEQTAVGLELTGGIGAGQKIATAQQQGASNITLTLTRALETDSVPAECGAAASLQKAEAPNRAVADPAPGTGTGGSSGGGGNPDNTTPVESDPVSDTTPVSSGGDSGTGDDSAASPADPGSTTESGGTAGADSGGGSASWFVLLLAAAGVVSQASRRRRRYRI